jgi:hypothetical protein
VTTKIALVLVLLTLAAGSAQAGGWATAGLAAPPEGIAAGEVWNARVKLLQHGRTPLEGVKPTVTIRGDGTTKTFAASPTGEPGVYVAHVSFPSGGEWRYEVNDGFTGGVGLVTSFPQLEVAPRAGGGGGTSAWWIALALPALAAAGALALRRRASGRPARAAA